MSFVIALLIFCQSIAVTSEIRTKSIAHLSFRSVALFCETKEVRAEWSLHFAESARPLICEEWIAEVELNRLVQTSDNVCSLCTIDWNSSQLQSNMTESKHICSTRVKRDGGPHNRIFVHVFRQSTSLASGRSETESIAATFDFSCSFETSSKPNPQNVSGWYPASLFKKYWNDMFWIVYMGMARSAMRLNMRLLEPEPRHWSESLSAIPAFVMNLPSRPDRRDHMDSLLSSIGFERPIFAEAIDFETNVDIEALVRTGRITPAAVARISAQALTLPANRPSSVSSLKTTFYLSISCRFANPNMHRDQSG
jgi:hypothetical protein